MKWIGLDEALADAGRASAARTLGNQTNLAVGELHFANGNEAMQ